jgi:hypothetical protein
MEEMSSKVRTGSANEELAMDINGAKALKKRLAESGTEEVPPAEHADVPADAPPVYRWTGKAPPKTTRHTVENDTEVRGASRFSRLSLSFR